MKKSVWKKILKVVMAIVSAALGALGGGGKGRVKLRERGVSEFRHFPLLLRDFPCYREAVSLFSFVDY